MNIKDLLEEARYIPKRKAATHGGEYSSPCPFCKEGDDRFLSWPQRCNNTGELQGGRYSCRVCGKYGDAINFLKDLYGFSFKEACEKLRIQPQSIYFPYLGTQRTTPPLISDPALCWQEKALAFTDWCYSQLLANPKALSEVMQRGFSLESITRFKIGFCPTSLFRVREDWGLEPQKKENGKPRKLWLPMGITIPTFSAEGRIIKIKIRRTDWKEGDKFPKYVEISGSKQCLSIYGKTSLTCALVLESELDALLIQQFAAGLVYCVALGGSTKSLDLYCDRLLRSTPLILFCPDFDKAGKVAWDKWKNMFPSIERILTPDGKGAGDAHLAGVNLKDWLEDSINAINQKAIRAVKRSERDFC